ncbi:Cytochrome b561 and DOMON domain-containing protein [Striga hermonthica]|uniref:Cytochrome b561 and DOMON domain-containing protein n=1 Tax=Striga hermonthica TaxID=68872 RepID=A0A9N7NBI7_STRHE|nr:Cytochrome b561 and DOMON domain-containing protein [Striga hermonthica]
MATSYLFFAAAMVAAALISPALSQPCVHTPDPDFPNCKNLDQLNATLRWGFDVEHNTLFVNYSAPSSASGWVAWGLNPTATGMLGAQALIAFRDSNGSYVVQTSNISTLAFRESPIAYPVSNLSARYSGGRISFAAMLHLTGRPASGEVNHLWQVGPVDSHGVVSVHDMTSDNLNSTGTLSLNGVEQRADAPAGEPAVAPTAGGRSGGGSPAGSGGGRARGGVDLGVVGLIWAVCFFAF